MLGEAFLLGELVAAPRRVFDLSRVTSPPGRTPVYIECDIEEKINKYRHTERSTAARIEFEAKCPHGASAQAEKCRHSDFRGVHKYRPDDVMSSAVSVKKKTNDAQAYTDTESSFDRPPSHTR